MEETGWWGIGEQVRGRYSISNTAESPVAAGDSLVGRGQQTQEHVGALAISQRGGNTED